MLSVAAVSPGSVMQAGQTFFTLVPVNAPLEVDAQITADQTGWVEVGQPADVKFLTFPFTHFGEASGSVRLISADTYLTGASSAATTGTPSGTRRQQRVHRREPDGAVLSTMCAFRSTA